MLQTDKPHGSASGLALATVDKAPQIRHPDANLGPGPYNSAEMRRYRTVAALALACGTTVSWASDPAISEAVLRGDAAWARRAEGHDGDRAQPGPISEAIEAYAQALADDPGDQFARIRLLRALFYMGDYVLPDGEVKLPVFERGQILGEEGITLLLGDSGLNRRGGKGFDRLIAHLREQPHAAGVYYWAAAHWGLWGRHKGKIAAARQGVAGKVRDYAEIVVALDPDYEAGGGHRMLGRLHAEAPKLPFVTGWIDRGRALEELQKARALSGDALTGLYYAEALLDYDPARRDYALTVLKSIVDKPPSEEHYLEELRAINDARVLLESLEE